MIVETEAGSLSSPLYTAVTNTQDETHHSIIVVIDGRSAVVLQLEIVFHGAEVVDSIVGSRSHSILFFPVIAATYKLVCPT